MYNERPITVENITSLPKTAAKIAAGLLILGVGPTYFPANDLRRPQAKVFSEPEVFAQAQRGSLVVVLNPAYSAATDVTRLKPQAKVFSEQEIFVKEQRSTAATLNVPAYFYNLDVRRASQAKIFSDPEIFIQAQRGSVILFPSFDVTTLKQQTRIFSEPETFISTAPRYLLTTLTIPYNAATDIQRKRMSIAWSDTEIFVRVAPFSQVIINGTSGATTMRVRATQRGHYQEIFRDVGDIFDILAKDFSDSTVSVVPPTDPAYPVFGWMQAVNSLTPLYSYALANQGLSTKVSGDYVINSNSVAVKNASIYRYVV